MRAKPKTQPAKLKFKPPRQGKPGWWLPVLLFVGLVWLLGGAAPLQGAAALGASLLLGSVYLLLGFSATRALGWRSGGVGLLAWVAAADQVHGALAGSLNVGLVQWLAALLAGWLGSTWATQTLQARYRHAQTSQGNLSFQMDFEDSPEASERKIA